MDSISQAVFLCGGLGKRLLPITKNVPKPMVLINDRPFIYFLLKQLSTYGIKRFLLLTGYLGDQIYDYFGDGKKWGWKISYSNGPVEWETARRIWEARNLIDESFLISYSDNFVQIQLEELYQRWKTNNSILAAHIFEKKNGNVSMLDDEMNFLYQNKNDVRQTNQNYVELGYILAKKEPLLHEMLELEESPNICFSSVIKKISQKHKLSGVVINDQYHSISDPIRLELTKKYLKPKRLILLDRDGTINKKARKGKYISKWEQFKFIKKNVDGLKELSSHGFEFIVITNQAGVSTNQIDPINLNQIHTRMIKYLNKLNIKILKIYVSTDHWQSNSFRRKPNPGMLFEASKEFLFRLDHTFFIGDDPRDCMAAVNAGCGSLFLTNKSKDFVPEPNHHGKDIMQLVPYILNSFSKFQNNY
tara:strand:- start:80 stop:1333 length:1254 start_codon:yes stop_codon:yes gene_type:complete